MFVPLNLYSEIGLFKEKYKVAGDYEFILRAINKNIRFLFLPLKKFMGGRGIFLYREEIEPLLKYGYKFINMGDTVLDGGANQGIYTLSFGKKVGKRVLSLWYIFAMFSISPSLK